MKKKETVFMILLLVTLLVAVIGGTYAFFTAGISQGEEEATLKVGAGQLKIKFTNTNSIQITENVQPTPAKNECTKQTGAYYCNQSEYEPVGVKTFTLTGTNTTDASKNMKMLYNIKLVIPQNQFSSGALKYTLVGSKEANDNGKVVNIDTWKDIPTGSNTTGTILGSGYFMPGENVVHTYTLNIYFPDNHIVQDADKNKVFGGLIEVTTDEIKDSVPKGWNDASEETLLGAIKRDNVVSEPITIPGQEVSAYTLDDAPEQTQSVSSTFQLYYITYGTGWEANGNGFNLTGATVTNNTYANSYSDLVGKYLPTDYLATAGSSIEEMKNTRNLNDVYYIVNATANSYSYKALGSNKNIVESVFASTQDDYGTSYYYRGTVENNYVEYANMCWRLVRVTGDGSIKLVLYNYNGLTDSNNAPSSSTPCNETGEDYAFARYEGDTYGSAFNSNYNDNAYVGLMYGAVGASSYAETHANTNPSTILTNLNKWYTNVLSKQTNFSDSQLADTIWCNDKSVVTDKTFNPNNDIIK